MRDIHGRTEVYGVIGDPIGHSVSPQIQNYFAECLGHEMVYAAFHVKPGCLAEAIRGAHSLGIRGLNVTIPHKKNCIAYLTGVDAVAERVGSVNTLQFTGEGYVGTNTDWIGMRRTLEAGKISVAGRSVVVLGAGGSAPAACVMAAEQAAGEIYIVNRTLENAASLARHINRHYPVPVHVLPYEDIRKIPRKHIVIQTTSIGFGDQAGRSPIEDMDFFKGVDMAFDIIYSPRETEFLRQARSVGVAAVNGFAMLVYQAAAAYEIWRGIRMDRAFVEDAVLVLTQRLAERLHS